MTNVSENYIEAIQYLGKLYDFLDEKFFESALSKNKPVITVYPDERNKALGWFVLGEVWRRDGEERGATEINIVASTMRLSPHEIAAVLLHEMVHQYCYDNKFKDCSRSGQYHNKLFKRIAESHGLTVDFNSKIGYAITGLTLESRATIGEFVKDEKFLYRESVRKGQRVKSSSTRKYVCPVCGQSVRATKAVNIMCADCDEKMVEEESL